MGQKQSNPQVLFLAAFCGIRRYAEENVTLGTFNWEEEGSSEPRNCLGRERAEALDSVVESKPGSTESRPSARLVLVLNSLRISTEQIQKGYASFFVESFSPRHEQISTGFNCRFKIHQRVAVRTVELGISGLIATMRSVVVKLLVAEEDRIAFDPDDRCLGPFRRDHH